MQIGFAICLARLINWEVEINDDVHLIDVDTTRQDVRRDKYLLMSFAEAIKNGQSLLDCQVTAQHPNALTTNLL